MPYCLYCGAEVRSDASFCSGCGKAVSQPQPQPQPQQYQPQQTDEIQMQKNAVRQSEMNVLGEAIAYFSQNKMLFDRYHRACDMVNHYARGARSALLVWGCIIITFGFLISLVCLTSGDIATVFVPIIMFILPAVLMITGGILMKVNNRSKFRKYLGEYERLSREMSLFYAGCPNCPLGPEYVNPDTLMKIMDVLRSGRADTIKEGINFLVSGRKQMRINDYLSRTERNTESVNCRTGICAIVVPGRMF